MAEGEPRGVHLSDKHIVFVLMTATVAAVVVFLFGVFVGRGVREVKGPMTDEGMTASADVVPDATGPDAAVADGATRPAPGGAAVPLSYPERLGKTPPAEQVIPAPPPVGDRPGDTPPPDVPAEPIAAAPAPAAKAPETSRPGVPGADAPYTVQVAAVKRRDEAEAIVKRLKANGYDAYVFVPEGDHLGVFRVRIGAFKDKRQADQLAERLLSTDKRYTPWVTR
jgi:cell division septation protein DedD